MFVTGPGQCNVICVFGGEKQITPDTCPLAVCLYPARPQPRLRRHHVDVSEIEELEQIGDIERRIQNQFNRANRSTALAA